MLGESIFAATVAIQTVLDDDASFRTRAPSPSAACSRCSPCGGCTSRRTPPAYSTSSRAGFIWGYGHYAIFASAAALGAGVEVNVDSVIHEAHISSVAAAAAFTVPVAILLLSIWVIHWSPHHMGGWHRYPRAGLRRRRTAGDLQPATGPRHRPALAAMVAAGIAVVRRAPAGGTSTEDDVEHSVV